jgi:RimJ/RimL family protein N-acetyltransferase
VLSELDAGAFERTRPLLTGQEHNLSLSAVVEGTSPGRFWTDDTADPRIALALTPEGYSLIGELPTGERADALKGFILNTMIPEARERRWGSWGVNYPDEGWEELLGDIFADLLPLWDYERYFVLRELRLDWREGLPAGFSMERATGELLARSDLKNVDRCRDWAVGNFGSAEEFDRNGFGFCLVHGEEIASWCVADCVVGHRAEVGIHTDESYRRRGLARCVVAAAVEHCLANGITQIGWHCGSANLASAATAVGFKEVLQHPYVTAWINRFEGLLVHGNQCLVRQQYGAAAGWYERAFAELDAGTKDSARSAIVGTRRERATYHYKAACAWSLAGHSEAASRNLERALEYGTDRWMLC